MIVEPTLARQVEAKLIAAISADLPGLESLLKRCSKDDQNQRGASQPGIGDVDQAPNGPRSPTKGFMPDRLFAIGDCHGCSTALKSLIDAINPRPDDTIVVLGDVIDWGPDSRTCVGPLIDLAGRCQFVLVRGNHEEMLFAALESQSELRSWLKFGGEEIRRRGDCAFTESSCRSPWSICLVAG